MEKGLETLLRSGHRYVNALDSDYESGWEDSGIGLTAAYETAAYEVGSPRPNLGVYPTPRSSFRHQS